MWGYSERSLERKRHQQDQALAERLAKAYSKELINCNRTVKFRKRNCDRSNKSWESLQIELIESQRDQQTIRAEIDQLQHIIAEKETGLKNIYKVKADITLGAGQAKQKITDLGRHIAQLAKEKQAAEQLSISLQQQLENQSYAEVSISDLERLKADLNKAKVERDALERQIFESIEQDEREKQMLSAKLVDLENNLYQLEYENNLILEAYEVLEQRLTQYEAKQS